jgi:hypothetical protein
MPDEASTAAAPAGRVRSALEGDRITDIRGFDDRTEAAARAGLAAP